MKTSGGRRFKWSVVNITDRRNAMRRSDVPYFVSMSKRKCDGDRDRERIMARFRLLYSKIIIMVRKAKQKEEFVWSL